VLLSSTLIQKILLLNKFCDSIIVYLIARAKFFHKTSREDISQKSFAFDRGLQSKKIGKVQMQNFFQDQGY
jgi:hypothetical protein